MYRRVAQRMDFPRDLQWGGAVNDNAFFLFYFNFRRESASKMLEEDPER